MATRWLRREGVVTLTAPSLEDFLSLLRRLRRAWGDELWFRGQRDARKELIPRTYRHPDAYKNEAEDELRWAFQMKVRQFPMVRPPTTEWEHYFLMQHYGMPTRLLDWSEGALLALHFALRSNRGRTDAAVWVLDPFWLNRHVVRASNFLPENRRDPNYRFILDYMPDPTDKRTKWIRKYLPKTFSKDKLPALPAAVEPPHIDRRIAAQLSTFTIHGDLHNGLGHIARTSPDARLARIRIPERAVKAVRTHLVDCGVSDSTVFQDIEGLGRELVFLHTGLLPD